MTKYEKWYAELCARGVERRASKIPKKGFEDHHVIPKSHGGTDAHSNLARLTPREHFVAHLLLYKIHKDQAMSAALWAMSNVKGIKINSRLYAELRCKMTDVGRKSIQTVNADPNLKRRLAIEASDFMTKLWADPDYRNRKKKAEFTDEQKEASRKRMLKLHSDPAFIEKATDARLKKCKEADYAALLKERAKQLVNFCKTHNISSKGGQAAKRVLSKPVRCVQTNSVFPGLTEAAEWVSAYIGRKIKPSNICSACKGNLKTAYGFNWEYA